MSDEPMVTEREARMRERKAFEDGGQYMHFRACGFTAPADEMHAESKRRYPITKKVPRLVRLPGGIISAHVDDEGKVRFSSGRVDYLCSADMPILADLLANPFEEVPL